jgi:hypothetical protein
MDRTIVNIVSLLLGGAGILVVLTKFNVPELNLMFVGENPFALKRDNIESTMTWVFTCLALLGIVLQVVAEVLGDRLPARLHGIRTYFVVSVLLLIATGLLVRGLTAVGNGVAKKRWLPRVVTNQSAVYQRTRFVLEHDGWTREELPIKDTLPNADQRRRMNIQTAEESVALIEKLLEIPSKSGSLRERMQSLRAYFGEHSRE